VHRTLTSGSLVAVRAAPLPRLDGLFSLPWEPDVWGFGWVPAGLRPLARVLFYKPVPSYCRLDGQPVLLGCPFLLSVPYSVMGAVGPTAWVPGEPS
jgi:hypothetical protein